MTTTWLIRLSPVAAAASGVVVGEGVLLLLLLLLQATNASAIQGNQFRMP
jgi:hypothetical protein